MSAIRFAPIVVAVIVLAGMVAYAYYTVPSASIGSGRVTITVGYPDSLDESDVTDMYAYQLLSAQGIDVVPTFYTSPPLSYKALISDQVDIAFDSTAQTIARGPGVADEQTTCVASYVESGTFLTIANSGITSPSQMLGKTQEDGGPGTSSRTLDLYNYQQANVPVTTAGVNSSAVYLKKLAGNSAKMHDLETNVTQAETGDDFLLSDVSSPSINNTAHNGPYHVLFYAPNTVWDNCFAVRDSWLSVSANQKILVKFIAAIYEAQRYFISNPSQLVSFAEQQLPLTSPAEIQFVTAFYPAHFIYWPYGSYNLQGNQNLYTKYNNTVQYLETAGDVSGYISNSTVKPYGVVDKWFEYQALQSLGPYKYPSSLPWVTPAFAADVSSWVPSSMGGVSS
ncbi:MAG: hypothetical protein JRN52_08695 [Nitrososphaerota archaeon]|nr:hypothetical protein [Nitrososphaerota archaeon]